MTILQRTLEYLQPSLKSADRRISTLCLGNYFTVVQLDDERVGACMSYYWLSAPVLNIVQQRLTTNLADDPCLLDLLFQPNKKNDDGYQLSHRDEWSLLVNTLQATVISALSARSLRDGGDAKFSVSDTPPSDLFADAERALVVGFGGYMAQLVKAHQISTLYIADLSYPQRRQEMEVIVAQYQHQYPGKTIRLSDGYNIRDLMREVDLVSITGSALCNGTLDLLLQQAEGVPRIIVQGQSAAIHPGALFDAGVHVVSTTLKPKDLVRAASLGPDGVALRPFLEGGLPWIFLRPTNV